MRIGSLFAGIGGFDLAAERAPMRVLWQAETGRFPRRVLRARFPDTELLGDVRQLSAGQLATVDVLCGGWPCQDLSIAGQRAGLAGERSGLFREFVRIAGLVRPRWIVGENVPGLLSSNGGQDMGAVLGALAELGYSMAWRVLDAQHWGVPQRRRRVFFVGCLGDRTGPVKVLFEREGGVGYFEPRSAARQAVGPTLSSRATAGGGLGTDAELDGALVTDLQQVTSPAHQGDVQEMSPTLHQRGDMAVFSLRGREGGAMPEVSPLSPALRTASGGASVPSVFRTLRTPGGGGATDSRYAVPAIGGVRRLTPLECERLQGFPDGWTCLCPAGGVTRDCVCPIGPRYAALGNAVAVPVAQWMLRRIAAQEQG